MMQSPHSEFLPESIIKEAAAWLSRMHEKPLSEAEQQALDAWRLKSTQHQQAWKRAELLSHKFGGIPSGLGMAILDAPQSPDRRKFIKPFVVLAIAVPSGLLAYRELPWQSWNADIQTAKGEQKTLQLADGSTMNINTGSALDVVFDEKQRLVKLYQGEVYIETAHDKHNRPFLVETEHGRLHALGTKFVVRKQEGSSYLGVIEGAVAVQPNGHQPQNLIVEAGQQVMFTTSSVFQQNALDDNVLSWLDGILYADNMPLKEFVSTLSRYRTGILRCDPSAANIPISGAFQLKDTERILEVLQQTRPVYIEWRTRYWGTIYKNN